MSSKGGGGGGGDFYLLVEDSKGLNIFGVGTRSNPYVFNVVHVWLFQLVPPLLPPRERHYDVTLFTVNYCN